MNSDRTKGKLIVFNGSIYEENPREERLVAEMFRDPDLTTGKYLRPATESDANAQHFVDCWNAIEELGGDPQEVVNQFNLMKRKLVLVDEGLEKIIKRLQKLVRN